MKSLIFQTILEGKPKQGPKIKNGMVFCIEPMVCQVSGNPGYFWRIKWSVISEDRLRSSHYEHTVAIIDNKAVILTTRRLGEKWQKVM